MPLANIVLIFGVWIFTAAEVWFTKWMQRTGRYRPSVLSGICCLAGCGTLYLSGLIANERIRAMQSNAPPAAKDPSALSAQSKSPQDTPQQQANQTEKRAIPVREHVQAPKPQSSLSPPSPALSAPAVGDLREQAINLANEIDRMLWNRGRRFPDGSYLPGTVDPRSMNHDDQVRWEETTGEMFRSMYFKDVVLIRDEFGKLNIRCSRQNDCDELDSMIEATKAGFPMFSNDAVISAEDLRYLASKLPQ